MLANLHVNVSNPAICYVKPRGLLVGLTRLTSGHIRTWDRPKEGLNGSQIALSGADSPS